MEQEPPDEPLTIRSITACARCGGGHEDVIARHRARPFAPAEAGGLVWTHWAPCPTSGDPILIMVEPPRAPWVIGDVSEVRRG
jgi:hypothetical protein